MPLIRISTSILAADVLRQPPEAPESFLHGDKSVVAVTAGSVAPSERTLFTSYYQTSITSVLACGARALLINAPENIVPPQHSADVLQLPFAPFSEIFPACTAVIHHGGSVRQHNVSEPEFHPSSSQGE
jgi:UDP:flavonoid glycosyltransferase YjiC (YdhE family)